LKHHELSLRAVIVAIILTLILAAANSFLALKLGMLTSASIPAAILSMGILRFFKNSNVWENNLVQTAASAGEAVAGGIVYTIPALVIIGFWHDFPYWQNFLIALTSGLLGVLFSVPLRQSLVHHPDLPFPEGRAIAAILQNQSSQKSFRDVLIGVLIGALIDLLQTGFHVLSAQSSVWVDLGNHLFFFAMGFSVAMVGSGFLIGIRMSMSILIGLVMSWFIILPMFSTGVSVQDGALIWEHQIRYIGIGALLFSGVSSLILIVKPLLKKMMKVSVSPFQTDQTETDLPKPILLLSIVMVTILVIYLLMTLLPLDVLHLSSQSIAFAIFFILLVGFIMAVVSAYLSAMVGVSASPGSAVVISALLLAAWGVISVCGVLSDNQQLLAAESIVIVLASMVTGIAAISNDNIQDLKVGQLIGATPWRQQLMLMLGVFVSALIIPAVMQSMYKVWGIAGHHGGENSLPAPVAAMLATLTDGFFQHALPWNMIAMGSGLLFCLMLLLKIKPFQAWGLSYFGVAIGMYLPQETSIPLIFGGILAWVIKRRELKGFLSQGTTEQAVCLACGLVAGSAVMDVILAFVFAWANDVDALALLSPNHPVANILSLLMMIVLFIYVLRLKYQAMTNDSNFC
jgi:putative OPT family oligopeptide transporter